MAGMRTGQHRRVDAELTQSGSSGVTQKTSMGAQDGERKVDVSNELMDALEREWMMDGTLQNNTLVADGALPAGHLLDFLRLVPWIRFFGAETGDTTRWN